MNKVIGIIAWVTGLAMSVVLGLLFSHGLRSIGSSQQNIFVANPILSDAMVALPSLLVGLFLLLYDRVDAIYFTLNKWRLWFGALVRVELTAEYHLSQRCDFIQVRDTFRKHFPNDKRKGWTESDGIPLLTLRNMVLRLNETSAYEYVLVDKTPPVVLFLESTETEMPFRTWERDLGSLASFFLDLEQTLNPNRSKYTCKVLFPGSNPYFGLFLRKARVPELTHFTYFAVEFTENIGGIEEVVQIGKSRVSIVAESVAGWQQLAKKYIALSVPPTLSLTTE